MDWILRLLGVNPLGTLVDGFNRAHEARLTAANDKERIAADQRIEAMGKLLALHTEQASVIKTGMQYRAFWVVWLTAALPCAAWLGWGMLDSLTNGALPDVAELPPQLKQSYDLVLSNIFYTGVAGGGMELLAKVIGSKK
jgi:hypothetical protein